MTTVTDGNSQFFYYIHASWYGRSSKIMTRHKLPVGLEEKVYSGEFVLSPPLALQSAQFASSSAPHSAN